TVPNCVCYDPAYAYEIATIIEKGLKRMVDDQEDVFYYVTLQNENYEMPAMPHGVKEGILRGMYRLSLGGKHKSRVQLFGSGSILREVIRAAEILAKDFDVGADVWSVTSYQQLRRDALACERWNRLNPAATPRVPYVETLLGGIDGPFVAASDWMRSVPEMITRWIPGTFVPLGTDGFGHSDTREALREHFEVNAESIAHAALFGLARDGKLPAKTVAAAAKKLGIDKDKRDPTDFA
ncbi:MAG: pyruvate dehydrogenase (acetyl-transferring), homodimeric type, partial [Planctomycetes bacterium]|nr:pyruvate dehydrogenase (acetyl-transferring), homodimeric type [Planctomycetota bacterium]